MFKHFELENFRVFDKETRFNLSGINVFTGKNSSGKSSIFKGLLLLKENFNDQRFLKTLKFDSGIHGLGSLQYSLCNHRKNNKNKGSFLWPSFTFNSEYNPSMRIKFKEDSNLEEKGFIYGLEFFSEIHNITFGSVEYIKTKNNPLKARVCFNYPILSDVMIGISKKEKQKVGTNKRKKNILDSFAELDKYGITKEIYPVEIVGSESPDAAIYDLDSKTIILTTNNSLWEVINQVFAKITKDEILSRALARRMKFHFSDSFKDFLVHGYRHLPSIRGQQRRLYFDKFEDSSISRLLVEYIQVENEFQLKGKYSKEKRSHYNDNREFLSKWLVNFELGEELFVSRELGVATSVKLKKENKTVNLADMGFGATQILAIILQIYVFSCKIKLMDKRFSPYYAISIEEPESNLHPDFQTKLAELFFEAFNVLNIQFLLETHSEYMIRKMQLLIANGNDNIHKKFEFYYLNNKDSDDDQVVRMQPKSDGTFSKSFGPGFYDEASNLVMDFYEL